MPVLMKEVREVLTKACSIHPEEEAVFYRRAREVGLFPKGRSGYGADSSAVWEPEHALLMFLILLGGERPKQAVERAAQISSMGGDGFTSANEGEAIRHWNLGQPVSLWFALLDHLTALRSGEAGDQPKVFNIQYSDGCGQPFVQLSAQVKGPGICVRVMTFHGENFTRERFLPEYEFTQGRQRISSVGGFVLAELAALYGPLPEGVTAAEAIKASRNPSESVLDMYRVLNALEKEVNARASVSGLSNRVA